MSAILDPRAAFIERRRSGIGGSDVAAILGFSEWSTAIDVYLKKRGLVEDDDTSAMERGRYREDALIRWYRDTKNVTRLIGPAEARRDGDGFFRHASEPWLFANVDEEVRDEAGTEWVVDAKCSFSRKAEWGDEGTDNIPDDAFWQGLHYTYVRQRPRVDFIVERLGAWPPRVYTVKRDDELYGLILPQLRRFWFDHVLPGEPPPPNFADPKVIEAIKALHPALAIQQQTVVEIPESLEFHVDNARKVALRGVDVLTMIEFLKARQKRDKAVQDRLDAVLRHHIGDAQIGRVDLGAGETADVKRIFNKGGARPASVVAPYDYLRINWPKDHVHELSAAPEALRMLEGEAINV